MFMWWCIPTIYGTYSTTRVTEASQTLSLISTVAHRYNYTLHVYPPAKIKKYIKYNQGACQHDK